MNTENTHIKSHTIRKVRKGDNKTIADIIRSIFEEHDAPRVGTVYSDPTTDNLFELFSLPNSILWVAEIDSTVVGCCGIYPTQGLPEGYAELVKFYLSSDARGRGIGKELMERSISSAKEMGYRSLYIESLPQYSRAIAIYEKQGFKMIDKQLGESGHSTCNIWMVKHL